MKFRIENMLDAPLEVTEEAMFDEQYYRFLEKNHSGVISIEVLRQDREGDRLLRRVRYTPKPFIEKVGPKRVPPEAIVFVEESTYDFKRHVLRFDNVPRLDWVARWLKNSGTITFTSRGSRTERVIEGELRVPFPILGKIAERVIYSQARKLLVEEVERLKDFLRMRPRG